MQRREERRGGREGPPPNGRSRFPGGDPMVMSTSNLARYIEPLLGDELVHVQNIRIGTKSLAYWPYRFTTDRDADDFLRLVERCVSRGRHVAIMAHFSHPHEMRTGAMEPSLFATAAFWFILMVPLITLPMPSFPRYGEYDQVTNYGTY